MGAFIVGTIPTLVGIAVAALLLSAWQHRGGRVPAPSSGFINSLAGGVVFWLVFLALIFIMTALLAFLGVAIQWWVNAVIAGLAWLLARMSNDRFGAGWARRHAATGDEVPELASAESPNTETLAAIGVGQRYVLDGVTYFVAAVEGDEVHFAGYGEDMGASTMLTSGMFADASFSGRLRPLDGRENEQGA